MSKISKIIDILLILLFNQLILQDSITLSIITSIIIFLGLYSFRTFDPREMESLNNQVIRVLAGTLVSFIPILIFYPIYSNQMDRYFFIYNFIFTLIIIPISNRIYLRMYKKHKTSKNYLVIGRKEEIGDVLKEIEQRSLNKLKFVEYINPSPEKLEEIVETRIKDLDIRDKARQNKKEKFKKHKKIHAIIVTDPWLEKLVYNEIKQYKKQNIQVEYLPELAEEYLKRIPIKVIQKFEEYYTLEFEKREKTPSQRVMDIIVSTVLITLFSPFMLIIAVWTLIEDGLPIVFRQNRIGYKGKTFRLSKFRSLKNIDCQSKSVEESSSLNQQPTTNNKQPDSLSSRPSDSEWRDPGFSQQEDSVILSESNESKDLKVSNGFNQQQTTNNQQPESYSDFNSAEGSNVFNQQPSTNNHQPESQSDSYTPNDGIEQRVLKIGKITRKTRLDETLQFWNVLNGTMSIVGSRPEMEEFHKEMKEKIPYYAYRLDTNPGITGWAQINYKHTTTLEDYRKKTEYDLYYVKNRTLLLDIQIMLKTVETMFGMRGAR
jgi:lipopolysaccharide/colanic/teichoic acid biosynthesis glycosyltransferase